VSDDVFKSWKEERFIVAPSVLCDNEKLIVLTDVAYWNTHYEELKNWCDLNLSETQGMTVVCPDDETLLLFVLRWS
jgi:hypothetical protein